MATTLTILKMLREVIRRDFPGKKTMIFVPYEETPYQHRLRLALMYAKYENELLR